MVDISTTEHQVSPRVVPERIRQKNQMISVQVSVTKIPLYIRKYEGTLLRNHENYEDASIIDNDVVHAVANSQITLKDVTHLSTSLLAS